MTTEPQTQNHGADGAQTLTPEQARLVIEAARAGVTPEQIAAAQARLTQAQAAAAPVAEPPPADAPFVIINPRLPVFGAIDKGDELGRIQGFLLAQQFDPSTKQAFFIVQLTEPSEHTKPSACKPGDHVCIWATDTLTPLAHMVAVWGPGGVCESAWEVIVAMVDDEDEYLIHARRIASPAAVRAPAFAVCPLLGPDA